MLNPSLSEKLQQVDRQLRGLGRVLVAYSGGVDSTLLAALARTALGKADAVAVTADSPSLARADLAEAVRVAAQLDLDHRVISTNEVQQPDYRANTPARCYWCKATLFRELDELARAQRMMAVLYGAIADDLRDARPGHQAAREHAVRAPLQEAGLSKLEVRDAARALGLPNWDRPQNACLSSRVPHGLAVTEDTLRQIENAEALLRGEGFRQVRVRHLGARARIEVAADEVRRFDDPDLRRRIARALRALGFDGVGLHPGGYQPGGADRSVVDVPL